MKSLLISGQYFPPQTGGISKYMASVCDTLGRDEICCLTGAKSKENRSENGNGPRVYRRPAAFARSWALQAPSLGMALLEILPRERPNIVQISTAYDGYIGLWLRKRFGLPYLVYAHGNEILDAGQSEWERPRQSLRQASRVLAVSRYTAKLVGKLGVAAERVEVLHPGCDVHTFRPLKPRSELRNRLLGTARRGPVILSVGNLVARKGQDMVIRALPQLLARVGDVQYLIVGDGPYRAELERLATELGVREHLTLAGRVPNDQLPDIYALCDVFALPSREQLDSCDVEGFGIVFLEANAAGKPVVAGRSGGIGDAVVDGKTGLLVEPENPEDIAAAIHKLVANPGMAARIAEEGSARVVREFSWEAVGERLRDILRQVALEGSRVHAVSA